MNTDTGFTYQTAMGEITREVIETVADRPGDSQARRRARQQATVYTMMSFLPRDPVETMLAGHCVIFDHLLRDGARDTLRGQPEDIKLRARPGLHASGKMFLAHLNKFEQLRNRSVDKLAGQRPAEEAAAESVPSRGPEAPLDAAEGPAAGAADQAGSGPSTTDGAVPMDQPGQALPARQPAPGSAAAQPAAAPAPIAAQRSEAQRSEAQTAAPQSAAAQPVARRAATAERSAAQAAAPQSAAAPPAAQTAPIAAQTSVPLAPAQQSPAAQPAAQMAAITAQRSALQAPSATAQPAAQTAPTAAQGSASRATAPQSATAQPAIPPAPIAAQRSATQAGAPQSANAQPTAEPARHSAAPPNEAAGSAGAPAELPPDDAKPGQPTLSQEAFERALLASMRELAPRAEAGHAAAVGHGGAESSAHPARVEELV
jgi:hypothetical protein